MKERTKVRALPLWWRTILYLTLLAAMLTNRYLRLQNGGTPDSFFTTAFLLQDAVAELTDFPAVCAPNSSARLSSLRSHSSA
ncbi:MAG TPA: hypothetical protein VFR42_09430 [Candidatus Acidoferrum sp.]|nr:hypothetical protein [Candidatus Acidoferrum sp.]